MDAWRSAHAGLCEAQLKRTGTFLLVVLALTAGGELFARFALGLGNPPVCIVHK